MGIRVQAMRKYNHRSRCRCKIYSNGGNQNPSKARKQSPQRQGLKYCNGGNQNPSKAQRRSSTSPQGATSESCTNDKLGATKGGSRTEGWLSHPCWCWLQLYCRVQQLSEEVNLHEKGGSGRDCPAAPKSTCFNHGSGELYHSLDNLNIFRLPSAQYIRILQAG